MSSKYLLEALHRQTATGEAMSVADSFLNGTVRLVYRHRPDGLITRWRVEGPGLPVPAEFKTEAEARRFIRGRWDIYSHPQQRNELWGDL